MSIDQYRAMKMVLAIEEKGSLTAAAEVLNSSLPTVVRQLASLEAHLQVTLFDRTTRKIRLTDEGAIYIESARQMLQDWTSLEEALASRRSNKQIAPSGNIKIVAPVMFGRLHVMPIVNAFMKQYPKVTTHVLLQDKLTDLTEEGIDVAFRVGEINLPDMVAVCVGYIYPVVCVSADYFKTQAKVNEPNDLKFAKNIKNLAMYKGKHWKFNCNGKVQEVTVPISFTTNDIDSAIAHCVAGLGVGVFFSYQVETLIKAGIIIEILQPFRLQNIPVSLIYPNTKRHLSRTNYFIAYAKNALIARLDNA